MSRQSEENTIKYLSNFQIPYWQEYISEKLLIDPRNARLQTLKTIADLAGLAERPAHEVAKEIDDLTTIKAKILEISALDLNQQDTDENVILNCCRDFAQSETPDKLLYDIRSVDLIWFLSTYQTEKIILIVANRAQGRSAGLYLIEEGFTKIRYVLAQNVASSD